MCVWVCSAKTEDFLVCACLRVFAFVDEKVCWFLSNSIYWFVRLLRHLSDVVVNVVSMRSDSGAIFVSNNLKNIVHSPCTRTRAARHVYIFIGSLLRFPSQFTIIQHRGGAVAATAELRHSTNSLVRMFVIHLACLFRYRLLQLMRNRQMYLRLSTRLVFGSSERQWSWISQRIVFSV